MSPEELPGLSVGTSELLVLLAFSVASIGMGRLLFRSRASPFAEGPRGPREPPLWGAPEILIFIAGWFAAEVVLGMAAAPFVRQGRIDSPHVLAGLLVLRNACFVGLIAYLVLGRLGQPPSSLGFARASIAQLAGAPIVYLLSFFPVGFISALWILFLEGSLGLKAEPQDFLDYLRRSSSEGDLAAFAALLISAVVVAPLAEEVIFRGFLFGALRETAGMAAGAAVSSVIFALIHFSLVAFLPLVAVGCVLCYIYHRTGSLYPGMIYHAIFNGVSIVIHVLKDYPS